MDRKVGVRGEFAPGPFLNVLLRHFEHRGGEKHLEARAESVRRRRRHRRQKERETSEERASTGEPSQRRATLVQIAEPVASGSFLLEKVPHSQQGYVGVCNRGDGFVVLEGDSAERIATLEANGYEEVIPDDRWADSSTSSREVLTAAAGLTTHSSTREAG